MNSRARIVRKTHDQRQLLTPANADYAQAIELFLTQEQKRDEGRGDVTTLAYFNTHAQGTAHVVAKEKGILAGVQEVDFFLKKFRGIRVRFLKKDGEAVKKGEKICELSGSVRDLMRTERVVLNVLGRMSGIATNTKRIVESVRAHNSKILITPTRKTLWGLLDKRACALGGAGTHRLNLDNAILIKHNHIRASGVGVKGYLDTVIPKRAQRARDLAFIEIEVATTKDALTAAQTFSETQKKGFALPCFIMFDNMKPAEIRATMAVLKKAGLYKTIFFEASGGITQKNINSYAKTRVDVLSLGTLTNGAPTTDFSMRI